MKFKHLFEPIKLGGIELRNRIVFAPIGIGAYNEDESVNDAYFTFIEERAKETALIITQGTRPSAKFGGVKLIGTYDDKFIPGLSKFAASAHKNGAKIFIQSVMIGGNDPLGGYAPSVIDIPLYRDKWGRGDLHKPRELTLEQVKILIEDFAQGARRAKDAGFDGVEVHAAYGYLISEFICPTTNQRIDEYGGSFENRMRFPVEIIRAIKKVCGEDFPIGFKFNAHMDIEPTGIDEALGVEIAKRIAAEGVVYLHEVTMGEDVMFMALGKYPSMPTIYQPRNTTVALAENLKKNIAATPIIAAGGIITPEDSEKIIADGKADMVAVGRALLADPHWSLKAKQEQRIVPCIKCLVCHNEVVKRAKLAACSVNPYLCKERESGFQESSVSKKVMVIGAGPAGIVAALAASRRGHKVRLFEKNKRVGGMLIPSTIPDFKYEFDTLIKFYEDELKDSSVELFLDTKVTPDLVKKESPDVLIIAIGGVPCKPVIKGMEKARAYAAVDILCSNTIPEGRDIAVIGGGEVGCETALWLKKTGREVSIIEVLEELMSLEEMKYHTMIMERMLKKENVRVYTGSRAEEIEDSFIRIRTSNGALSEVKADFIVYATGFSQPDEQIRSLKSQCNNVFVIGDALQPGKIREAVHEGDRLGRLI